MQREYGDVVFEYVGEIEPKLDATGNIVPYNPKHPGEHPTGKELNSYGDLPFCEFNIGEKWNVAGVYVLTIADRLVFVGMTEDLSTQLGPDRYGRIKRSDCYAGGRGTACKINNLIYQRTIIGSPVSIWVHRNTVKKVRMSTRKRIREKYNPEWNA